MPLFDRNNPPHLDRTMRGNTLKKSEIAERFPGTRTPKEDVATGILLLWHDFWEEAHHIAQSDEGAPDYDLLHALVHRREPDLSNSRYWLRSAGDHPALAAIGSRMKRSSAKDPDLDKLVPDGKWNPLAFNESVRRAKTESDRSRLRALQAEEMIGFYEWLLS